jgi:hypothetical protein
MVNKFGFHDFTFRKRYKDFSRSHAPAWECIPANDKHPIFAMAVTTISTPCGPIKSLCMPVCVCGKKIIYANSSDAGETYFILTKCDTSL